MKIIFSGLVGLVWLVLGVFIGRVLSYTGVPQSRIIVIGAIIVALSALYVNYQAQKERDLREGDEL